MTSVCLLYHKVFKTTLAALALIQNTRREKAKVAEVYKTEAKEIMSLLIGNKSIYIYMHKPWLRQIFPWKNTVSLSQRINVSIVRASNTSFLESSHTKIT